MGHNLVLNMMQHGHEVLAWNRSPERRESARQDGINVIDDITQLVTQLAQAGTPKIIWLMISAGPGVEELILGQNGLINTLTSSDIIIDGGNSHYTDTQRRAAMLAQKGIQLVDLGISGGVEAARQGVCIMAGGDKAAIERVEPLLRDIAQPEGYIYSGASGAGHYLKMVHNAIEYGMMQAIAEGVNLVQNSEFKTDIAQLAHTWNHGSVIQGNLINFLQLALAKDPNLTQAEAEVGDLGTGSWAVAEALRLGVPFTSIANAVFTRYSSRQPQQSWLYKIISALRAQFGDHRSVERASR